MPTEELASGIYSVGVVDWSRHDFHGFQAPRGVTYNSYLIVDEKIALIDAVKRPFADELLENISRTVEPSKIDYVIANHAEPDHSSGMPAVMEQANKATVVCTERCRKAFHGYYGRDWQYQIVKTGEKLGLGKHTLQFLATPMVHWPDSMMTYLASEQILFSMDAFGQHIASSERYDDQLPLDIIMDEARRYYANIIMPLGSLVAKTLEAAKSLDIKMIAPSHGLIWRKHIPQAVQAYEKWASLKSDAKVAVIYDSMWDSTEMMARAVLDGAISAGANARLIHLRQDGRTEAAAELLEAASVAIGTPTLLNQPMPDVAGFLSYMRGLGPVATGKADPRGKGRMGLAFGSHGWNGGGAKWVHEKLAQIGYEMLDAVISCVYRPDQGTLGQCRQAGNQLGLAACELGGK